MILCTYLFHLYAKCTILDEESENIKFIWFKLITFVLGADPTKGIQKRRAVSIG